MTEQQALVIARRAAAGMAHECVASQYTSGQRDWELRIAVRALLDADATKGDPTHPDLVAVRDIAASIYAGMRRGKNDATPSFSHGFYDEELSAALTVYRRHKADAQEGVSGND